MSTSSVINLDLASAKKTDNWNTSTYVTNASRTIACGPEDDKMGEAYILQLDWVIYESMTSLMLKYAGNKRLVLPLLFAKFWPDPVRNNLIVCPMISPKLNNTFAQTSQNVVTKSVQFCVTWIWNETSQKWMLSFKLIPRWVHYAALVQDILCLAITQVERAFLWKVYWNLQILLKMSSRILYRKQ